MSAGQRASTACDICGRDTPHAHHATEVELERYARPTFEASAERWLNQYLPAKRTTRGAVLGVNSYHVRARTNPATGTNDDYVDPMIQALWNLWLDAWMSKPTWCAAFDNFAMERQMNNKGASKDI